MAKLVSSSVVGVLNLGKKLLEGSNLWSLIKPVLVTTRRADELPLTLIPVVPAVATVRGGVPVRLNVRQLVDWELSPTAAPIPAPAAD
jgi:hypothetical protein